MDIDELNRLAQAWMNAENSRPVADFDGLSPDQMSHMLFNFFGPECIIIFAEEADDSLLSGSSLFKISWDIFEYLSLNKTIKLTAKENLPLKLVKVVYAKGYSPDEFIDRGIIEITSETDWLIIHIAIIQLPLTDLAKKANNKMSLTKKGEKLYAGHARYKFYLELLQACCLKFNRAYNDRLGREQVGQMGFMYLIYLMKKYGKDPRDLSFYSEKYFTAFPTLKNIPSSYFDNPEKEILISLESRFFKRFCDWFGLTELTMKNTNALEKS